MNSEERVCKNCGCVIEGEEFEWVNDDMICKDCIEENYEFCKDCEEYHLKEEMVEVIMRWHETERKCMECVESGHYFYCSHCERWYNNYHYSEVETSDGSTICSDCYSDYYITCSECGDVILQEDAYYDDNSEEYYCPACSEKRKYIKNYGYKPRPIFKTKHDSFHISDSVKELMLGVELEIDYGSDPYDTAAEICANSKDVYIKHDGSLSSDGMEIVTHPCSLEYHMEELGWDKICDTAKANGYTSHDAKTCGLHIHVGRQQLGETDEERMETAAKIVMLVDRFWPQLTRFSRRRKSQLDEWAKDPYLKLESGRMSKEQVIAKALSCRNRGRYMAVNLTNYETIEFRLFNGTLKESTIKATLQLVWNICKMAKEKSVEDILRTRWKTVQNYVFHNELERYAKEKGITEIDDPSYIYLANEPVHKFKIGDIVRVIGNVGYNQEGLRHALGEVGRVIGINTEEGQIEVHFTRTFSDYLWRNRNGVYPVYYVNEENIETVFA